MESYYSDEDINNCLELMKTHPKTALVTIAGIAINNALKSKRAETVVGQAVPACAVANKDKKMLTDEEVLYLENKFNEIIEITQSTDLFKRDGFREVHRAQLQAVLLKLWLHC